MFGEAGLHQRPSVVSVAWVRVNVANRKLTGGQGPLELPCSQRGLELCPS